MPPLWKKLRSWFDAEDPAPVPPAAQRTPADLVVRLRTAADDLALVRGEVERSAARQGGADLTQAQLLVAAGQVIDMIADALTDGVVGVEGEQMERWRAQHASALYREVVKLVESARIAHARPPSTVEPVKAIGLLLTHAMPKETDVSELITLSSQLEQHFQNDIAYARASRGPREQMRLNELLGMIRSRTSTAEALLHDALQTGSAPGAEEADGRSIFNEILALWFLAAQELVHPDITSELDVGPDASSTGRYSPDNLWMMTDPVAKARYEREGRRQDLEEDLRYEVLRGRPFQPDDIAVAQQIDWLEQCGVVKRLASYWTTSPHAPVYRALQAGEIRLAGRVVSFAPGNDIVWLCQMAIEMLGNDSCVFVGNAQSSRVRQLCGTMHNAMLGARTRRHGGSAMSH